MNNLKVERFEKWQQNPSYRPEFENISGGYNQPLYIIKLNKGYKIEIDDTSCGDLGSRFFIKLYQNDKKLGYYYFNNLGEIEQKSTLTMEQKNMIVTILEDYEINYAKYVLAKEEI